MNKIKKPPLFKQVREDEPNYLERLRDEFAIAAMSVIANQANKMPLESNAAIMCYNYADAMIGERERRYKRDS